MRSVPWGPLLLLAFFPAFPVLGQEAPDWPRDLRLRGSLLVGAGPVEHAALGEAFLRRAAGDEGERAPSFVVIQTGGRTRWQDDAIAAAALAVLSEKDLSTGAEELRALCVEADGVWIDGERPELLLRHREAFGAVLRELLDRGGVIAFSGPCAGLASARWLDGFAVREGLGLFPDLLLERAMDEEGPWDRLHRALLDRPGGVGLRLPEGAAVELRGRRVRAMGSARASFHLPELGAFPRRVQTLRPGDRRAAVDWTAWRRDARERVRDDHPGRAVGEPFVPQGTLVIVGGGGMPEGLWSDMIEWAGGKESSFVYVPCSEAERIDREPGTVASLRRAGAGAATWIHTKDRDAADSSERILGPLREASGLWFGGGRQWNFVDSYHDTEAHRRMLEVLARGGVIGGSSAGASIQCKYLARGDPLGNRNILAPGYERGLGFLDGVAVDQHFAQRGRFADMSELIDTYPELLGVGIDESTALIVRGSVGEVRGRGRVHFYDRRQPVLEGEKDHASVGDGGRYELRERRVLDWGKGGDGASAGEEDGDRRVD